MRVIDGQATNTPQQLPAVDIGDHHQGVDETVSCAAFARQVTGKRLRHPVAVEVAALVTYQPCPTVPVLLAEQPQHHITASLVMLD